MKAAAITASVVDPIKRLLARMLILIKGDASALRKPAACALPRRVSDCTAKAGSAKGRCGAGLEPVQPHALA